VTGLAEAPHRPRLLCISGNQRLQPPPVVPVTQSVNEPNKTEPVPPEPPDSERRRIGKVVHDDRGNASVKWSDAPADYQRPVLELVEDAAGQPENAFNPYGLGAPGSTTGPHRTPASKRSTGNTTRTDLRKLSDWIKVMRELEERKRNGGEQD
jgi:hypothetical protein